MPKKPQDQPKKPSQQKGDKGRGLSRSDRKSTEAKHSPTPGDDAEWEERMDELDVEREELHKNQISPPVMIDPHELANIIKRLEELRANGSQEESRLNAHLEEALLHLNQAASELADGRTE